VAQPHVQSPSSLRVKVQLYFLHDTDDSGSSATAFALIPLRRRDQAADRDSHCKTSVNERCLLREVLYVNTAATVKWRVVAFQQLKKQAL
jgi:hypothetical protein